jgi:hypothetical protein
MAENRVGAQRVEPRDDSDVAALFALPQRGAERLPRFGGVAALRERFLDVRLELFVDLAAQTFAAKHISETRPKRHITPSSDTIIYRRLSICPVSLEKCRASLSGITAYSVRLSFRKAS